MQNLDAALTALDHVLEYLGHSFTLLRAINPAGLSTVDQERVDAAKGKLAAMEQATLNAQEAIRRERASQARASR